MLLTPSHETIYKAVTKETYFYVCTFDWQDILIFNEWFWKWCLRLNVLKFLRCGLYSGVAKHGVSPGLSIKGCHPSCHPAPLATPLADCMSRWPFKSDFDILLCLLCHVELLWSHYKIMQETISFIVFTLHTDYCIIIRWRQRLFQLQSIGNISPLRRHLSQQMRHIRWQICNRVNPHQFQTCPILYTIW